MTVFLVIIAFFNIFLSSSFSMGMPYLERKSLERKSVEEESQEVLAAKLTTAVFHFYAQWLHDEPLNLNQSFRRNRSILGYSFSYNYPAIKQFSDWEFKPFEGHLGFYMSYLLKGESNEEFFGVVGFHKSSNTIAVIFRGSQAIGEYFYNNFNFFVKLPQSQRKDKSIRNSRLIEGYHNLSFNGPIHAGYYNRLMTCQNSLLDAVLGFLDKAEPNPKLLITGHSLGGASACVLTGLIASDSVVPVNIPKNRFAELKDCFSKVSLIPFGAPRVSNRAYGTWLKNQGVIIKNFVGQFDVIPLLPPYQAIEPKLSFLFKWPRYEDIDERIELSSYDLKRHQVVSTHDVRVYWRGIADRENIHANSFPLFRLSNDSDYLKTLLDF